jgi:hypothetical protein
VDFKQKCNELRHSLCPPRPKWVLGQIPHIAEPLQRLEDETSSITQRELSRTLDKVNLNSANGADGISYKVLRTFHEASPSILPRLFNAMLSHSIHPQEWKHAVCVVIPKKGKPSYKDPSAYRPISLLSCFGKILETVLSKRVYNAARRTGAISQNQMGSILHHSATDTLAVTFAPVTAAIIHEIKQQKSAPKYRHHQKASLLTQDVSGAFNNTDPDILIEVMRRKAMPLYIFNWVQQFLSNRTLSFSFDGQIEPPTSFSSGLPQGSPISPVLFLIMENIITEPPPTVTEKTTSYVDDISLTQISPTYQESTRRLTERSQEQALRANMIGLSLAADKYELIHLSVQNQIFDFTNQNRFPDLIIQSTADNTSLRICPSDKIKILGVTIDKLLNFKP